MPVVKTSHRFSTKNRLEKNESEPCVQAHMKSLRWWDVWDTLQGGQRTQQVCHGCTSEQLFNCSWTHPEGNNTHLPLLVK